MFKRIAILVSLGISTAAVLTLTVLPFLLSLGRIKEVKESLNVEK
jgi:predicted RND superfamily exporter protein